MEALLVAGFGKSDATLSRHLTSWLMMTESRPPEDSVFLFQASAETRAAWPLSDRICLHRDASQICTVADAVPTEMCLPARELTIALQLGLHVCLLALADCIASTGGFAALVMQAGVYRPCKSTKGRRLHTYNPPCIHTFSAGRLHCTRHALNYGRACQKIRSGRQPWRTVGGPGEGGDIVVLLGRCAQFLDHARAGVPQIHRYAKRHRHLDTDVAAGSDV